MLHKPVRYFSREQRRKRESGQVGEFFITVSSLSLVRYMREKYIEIIREKNGARTCVLYFRQFASSVFVTSVHDCIN